jgi:cell division protease FtsH
MDDELGMVVYEENVHDISLFKPYSEETALKIDKKIKEYLEQGYATAKKIINQHKIILESIGTTLIEKEYLSGDEFTEMLNTPPTKGSRTSTQSKKINKKSEK